MVWDWRNFPSYSVLHTRRTSLRCGWFAWVARLERWERCDSLHHFNDLIIPTHTQHLKCAEFQQSHLVLKKGQRIGSDDRWHWKIYIYMYTYVYIYICMYVQYPNWTPPEKNGETMWETNNLDKTQGDCPKHHKISTPTSQILTFQSQKMIKLALYTQKKVVIPISDFHQISPPPIHPCLASNQECQIIVLGSIAEIHPTEPGPSWWEYEGKNERHLSKVVSTHRTGTHPEQPLPTGYNRIPFIVG